MSRRLRWLDLALVVSATALWLIWTSHGDLTRGVPGGQTAALAVLGLIVAGLALARLAIIGTLARLWGRLRVDPSPAVLALLLLIAVAPRLPGVPSPGFDLARYAPLEQQALGEAWRMLTTGDYRPQTFARPSGLLYLQTAAGAVNFLAGVSVDRWRALGAVQPGDLVTSAHLLNALLGIATVALVYLTGRRLYGRRAGLLAAALLALSPLAWLAAHVATEDALAALIGLAAFELGARSAEQDERGARSAERGTGNDDAPVAAPSSSVVPRSAFRAPRLVGALLLGVAAGVRPSLALLAVPFVLGLLLAGRPRPAPWAWGLLVVAALAGYLLAVPYVIAELPRWLDTGATAASEYQLRAEPGTIGFAARQLPAAIGLLAREETLLGLTGGLGALLALVRRGRPDLLLLSFLVPAGLLLLLHRGLDARHFVPYGPFLALLGGAALDSAWSLVAMRSRPARRRRKPARAR
jgi:hypothetical protein